MEQINNITEEINNNIDVTNKPKKEYKFTEKRKLAYEKMREKNRKKIYIPDLERLLFIHDKILTEINYLCMIDNLTNNLPIGVIYNISKFI